MALRCSEQQVLMSRSSVSGEGLLMLYQPTDGERQRRPRPFERPQWNPSCMPSIPVCCVKVAAARHIERAFLIRATLKHTKTELPPLLSRVPQHPLILNPFCVNCFVVMCAECRIPFKLSGSVLKFTLFPYFLN